MKPSHPHYYHYLVKYKILPSKPDPSGHDWEVLWFSIIYTLSSANIRDHDNDRYS